MIKTIIAIYGRQNEGKSTTIVKVFQKLVNDFPGASVFAVNPIGVGDVYAVITINGIRIGFESEGDPNSRILTQRTLETLATTDVSSPLFHPGFSNCDIILCASRTSGDTVNEIDRIAIPDFRTLWKSSYYAPNFNHDVINRICSEEIVNLIKSIITTEL